MSRTIREETWKMSRAHNFSITFLLSFVVRGDSKQNTLRLIKLQNCVLTETSLVILIWILDDISPKYVRIITINSLFFVKS